MHTCTSSEPLSPTTVCSGSFSGGSIVDGACGISLDAVRKLEGSMDLADSDKVRIVTNLLTVVSGEQNATPVINTNAAAAGGSRPPNAPQSSSYAPPAARPVGLMEALASDVFESL